MQEQGPAASFTPRIIAALVDGLLLGAAFLAFAAAGGSVEASDGGATAWLEGAPLALFLAFVFAYFWAFEWRMGATPGKRLNGVAVYSEDGDEIGPGQSTARNLLRFVDWLPLGYLLGFVVARIDGEERRRIGDRAARTVVDHELEVRAPWDPLAIALVAAALAAGLGGAALTAGDGGSPAAGTNAPDGLSDPDVLAYGEGNEELVTAAQKTKGLDGTRLVEVTRSLVDSDSSSTYSIRASIDPGSNAAELVVAGSSLNPVTVIVVGDSAWLGYDPAGTAEPKEWFETSIAELVRSGALPISSTQDELDVLAGARVVGPADEETALDGTPLRMTEFELPPALVADPPTESIELLYTRPMAPPGAPFTGYAGIDADGLLRKLRVSVDCAPGLYSSLGFEFQSGAAQLDVTPPDRDEITATLDPQAAAEKIRELLLVDPAERAAGADEGLVPTACPTAIGGEPSF